MPAQEEQNRSVDASSTMYTANDNFSHWLFLPCHTNTKTIFIGSKLPLNQMFKLFSLAFKAFYISPSSYHLLSTNLISYQSMVRSFYLNQPGVFSPPYFLSLCL